MSNYQDAVKYITTIKFMAPSYIIIGGIKPGEGVVITRDPLNTVDSWTLKDGLPKDQP